MANMNAAKHFKVELQQKYGPKHYRIQKKEDVMHKDLKMECTDILEKPWVHGVSPNEQPRYAKFVERPCTLQDVEVNDEIIDSGTLVCATHYMSPVQKVLDAVNNKLQLGYSLKTLSNDEVKQRKPFLLCGDDYEAIMEEQMRRPSIEYTVSQCDDEVET
eukprot:15184638-Ditylum_brightwellii.AAC.1